MFVVAMLSLPYIYIPLVDLALGHLSVQPSTRRVTDEERLQIVKDLLEGDKYLFLKLSGRRVG